MALSFLKKGAAAHKMVAQEEAKADALKNQPFRYWIPFGKDGQITFLDGTLDAEGLLTCPMFYEHKLEVAGRSQTFPCVKDVEDCPLCLQGDKARLIALFTVVDHSEWKDKQGKTHKNETRLFAAPRSALKILQKIATKRKGLAGIKFDVSRSEEKAAGCGDMFDFVDQTPVSQLLTTYKTKVLDYEKSVVYRTADELRQLGFGTGSAPVGAGVSLKAKKAAAAEVDEEVAVPAANNDDEEIPL